MPLLQPNRTKLRWAKPVPQSQQRVADAYTFLNSAAWRKLRSVYAKRHPLCEVCLHGKLIPPMPTAEIDHTVERGAGGSPLAWENLMALCKPHHGTKTRLEERGHLCDVVETEGGLLPAEGGRVLVMEKLLRA